MRTENLPSDETNPAYQATMERLRARIRESAARDAGGRDRARTGAKPPMRDPGDSQIERILRGLNPQQHEAVVHEGGRCSS